jgi:hypothetical protein
MICPDCQNLDSDCFRCDGEGILCYGCGETYDNCICEGN